MRERKPSAILEDIVTGIEHIQLYTNGLSFEQFSSHFMTVEACLYNLQVIEKPYRFYHRILNWKTTTFNGPLLRV